MKYSLTKTLVSFAFGAMIIFQSSHAASGFLTDAASGCKVWDPNIVSGETLKYTGTCKDGLADGLANVEWFVNGSSTEIWNGFFRNGFKYGHVRVKNSDYEHIGMHGNFEWEGEGRRTYSMGLILEGTFKGDTLNGFGKIQQPNGVKVKGVFRDSRLNGYGEVIFTNGGKHEGDFIDGKLNGFGVSTQTTGGGYMGNWRNGQMDGIGVLIKPDGSELPVSIFSNGIFVQFAGSSGNYSHPTPKVSPTKSLIEQEMELLANIQNTHQVLGASSNVRITSPDGKINNGIMWSNQQPGLLGGSTFIKINK